MRLLDSRLMICGALPLLLALGAQAEEAPPQAVLSVTTEPAGATVTIDGISAGQTPLTVAVPIREGLSREVRLEVLLPGYLPRTARLRLGAGEALFWAAVRLEPTGGAAIQPTRPGGGETDRPVPPPTEPVVPVAPTQPTEPVALPEGWPPAGWPHYLAAFRPAPGMLYRVHPRDNMPQVLIPTGTFTMGSTEQQVDTAYRMSLQTGESDRAWFEAETPQREVTLTGYWVDLHEVTVGQYCRFLNDVYPHDDLRREWLVIRGEDENMPFRALVEKPGPTFRAWQGHDAFAVSHVSWAGAVAYARWAGRALPTEAQWERACRAGTGSHFFAWGDDPNPPPAAGNLCDLTHLEKWPHIKRPGRYFSGYTDDYVGVAPVCSFRPNAYGLFDMIGNVWEWCRDTYDARFYAGMPATDPVNEADVAKTPGKVLRGGAYFNAPWSVRPGYRLAAPPESAANGFGFRTVVAVEGAGQ